MKKLVVGITAPGSVVLLEGQLKYFKDNGYETYLLAPNHQRVIDYCRKEGCEHLSIDIEREISIIKDIKSLIQIYKHFRRIKPDVVNLGTPKVSLLGMFAAKILGIKTRIYTCRGFRFEHEKGNKKTILTLMEKGTAKWAHKIICISESVRTLGLEHAIFSKNKTVVIHKGSSNGINLNRFNNASVNSDEKKNKSDEIGLKSENFVYGFVGRLVDRKGIKELYTAFDALYAENQNLRLLIVGAVEYEQISDKSLIENMQKHQGIIMVGSQANVPLFLSLMDVFILPAWWEGFGNVSVQAAAMGLPVISTDVTGSRDAVSKDYNGILIPPKSVEALKEAMILLFKNQELRQQLGTNGIAWSKHFDSKKIWEGMDNLYKKLVGCNY